MWSRCQLRRRPNQPLCSLRVLCASVVDETLRKHSPQRHRGHRGGTEKLNAKIESMKSAFRILSCFTLSLMLAALALTPIASAHRYHTSVTRLEYNADERLVEITVQTFADDIEAALKRSGAGNVRLDSKKSNELVLEYLQKTLEIRSDNARLELEWIGMELKGYTVWVYLQAKAPNGLLKTSVRNNLLFEVFPDQVNIVNVIADGKRASLVFKRGDPLKEIQ